MKSAVPNPLAHMHAAPLLRRGGMLLALLVWLPGCGQTGEAQAPATASGNIVAVARGRIDIEGGLLALSMPRAGTVAEVAVHEGEHVRKGQLLAMLDTEPARLAIDAAQSEVAEAQAQLKLSGIRQAAARQRAKRLRAAATAGAGDGQSADDADEAAAQLGAEHAATSATLSMAQQKLTAARYELKLRSLIAPADAQVTQVSVQAGASVSPESGPLLTLLPDQPRIVRAELNESFVGMVRPGMGAQVSANEGAPGSAWSAHVLRIGQVYGPATLENDPQVRANARTVECVLAFDQPQPQLRIGQRVLVRFDAAGAPGAAGSTAKE